MLHLASLLVATMGASAGSEMLFTRVYEKMIRREGDPAAVTFLMGYDSTPIRAEKSLYDVAMWCRERGGLATYLPGDAGRAARRATGGRSDACGSAGSNSAIASRTTCATTATSSTAWISPGRCRWMTPTPMLQSIKMYLAGRG